VARKRPGASAFKQQKLSAWQPTLTPRNIVATLSVIGAVCTLTGVLLLRANARVVAARRQYDGVGTDRYAACKVDGFGQSKQCQVRIKAPRHMKAPIYVYYELSNLHQNHRRYANSLNHDQLMGTVKEKHALSSCAPLKLNGTRTLNPCGLVANTMFSDVITLTNGEMRENSIAYASDKRQKFEQPDGFEYVVVDDDDVRDCLKRPCSTDLCARYDLPADCFGYECVGGDFDDDRCEAGDLALFYYPQPFEFQYLWETYPHVVSPLVGVDNEHFIVWMETAALPHFRKIYGRITHNLEKHDVLLFNLTTSYWVRKFNGKKWLVLSTESPLVGGKNAFLGIAYLAFGALCLCLATAFAALQRLEPRRLGDTSQANLRTRH